MSRTKRTQKFIKKVEKEWTQKFWSFIQKPWMSENPEIIREPGRGLSDNHWGWIHLSCNPNISFDIIQENPDKPWNWNSISRKTFQKDKESFIEEAYKKYLAAYKIQNWWKHITMSPYYAIGRKFIDKKYDELFV